MAYLKVSWSIVFQLYGIVRTGSGELGASHRQLGEPTAWCLKMMLTRNWVLG